MASILWRRLDTPGHDACSLSENEHGFGLEGCAIFVHEARPARLSYELSCDRSWSTQRGQVSGWIGNKSIHIDITRSNEGVWARNGVIVPGLERCFDLDLGFTPATNLSQIRRLALEKGQAASAPVAWLDVATGELGILEQRYERRSKNTFWYEAPRFEYAGLLDVSRLGFVLRYPELWEVEASFE